MSGCCVVASHSHSHKKSIRDGSLSWCMPAGCIPVYWYWVFSRSCARLGLLTVWQFHPQWEYPRRPTGKLQAPSCLASEESLHITSIAFCWLEPHQGCQAAGDCGGEVGPSSSRTCCRGAVGMRTILVPLENADCHSAWERKGRLVPMSIFGTKCSHSKGAQVCGGFVSGG